MDANRVDPYSGLATAAMLAVALVACSRTPAPANATQAPQVSVVTVHRGTVPVTTELPGRTSPYLVAQVRATPSRPWSRCAGHASPTWSTCTERWVAGGSNGPVIRRARLKTSGRLARKARNDLQLPAHRPQRRSFTCESSRIASR